jgi:hypothetical protein
MEHYGEDLALIHAAGFTAIASAAAAELLPRLARGSRVLRSGAATERPRACSVTRVTTCERSTRRRVIVRIAGPLRVGGLLLFDLATPRRAPAAAERTWTEGRDGR